MRTPDERRRRQDDWTRLDAPDAASAAIGKLEAVGQSAAEVAARQRYLGLRQRAEMAAYAGVVSEAEAARWREGIEQAAALRRHFFSLTQFAVWGDV